MDIEEFETLSEEDKRVVIFEADKILEWSNDFEKCELFYTSSFFIEVKTTRSENFKRIISTFNLQTIPLHYAEPVHRALIERE